MFDKGCVMKKIIREFRLSLRKFFIAAGITTMPFLAHAGYSMREPDPEAFTVPVHGIVISEETGKPIEGIHVIGDRWSHVKTDSDGRFNFYIIESEVYRITFQDLDGFEGGGFFIQKSMEIAREKVEDPIQVSLFRESDVTDIHGFVFSEETGEPAPEIHVRIFLTASDRSLMGGFNIFSDKNGQFSIQVPRWDSYVLDFSDTNRVFQWKRISVTADDIKSVMKVDLTHIETTNVKNNE